MKQRIRLKGRLKAYLEAALVLGAVLAGVNIGIYFLDIGAGVIVSAFLVVYFIVMLILLYYNKPIIMNEFISFATQYGQIQRKLLRDLELPHVLMDEDGRIIWTNIAFEQVVHKEKGYCKSITTLFPSITKDKLRFEDAAEFEISFEEKEYTLKMKRISVQEVLDNSDVLENDEYNGYLIAAYFFDETALKTALRQIDSQSLVVGFIYLDNYDEALESVEDVRRSLLIALIDRKVNKYIASLDGIVRKTEKDKYLVILKKEALLAMKEARFDILEEIHPDTQLVCELSCHQLEYIHVSPHIGVLLNIHEEHLDHYGTMEKYIHAKQQIYLHQLPQDLLFCGMDVTPADGTCRSRIFTVSDQNFDADVLLGGTKIHFDGHSYQIPSDRIPLLGHHNHIDIAFVYAICRTLGLNDTQIENGLISYEPLPHRLRLVGEKNSIRFYDDSISTICDTTIQALKSVSSVGSVLIGGMDRGIDYQDLISYLSVDPVPHIILMAATGKRIYEEIHASYPDFHQPERLHLVDTLEEAVAFAKEVTPAGYACVLSPAAASYGIFKNFEERGDVFTKLALEK